LPAATTVDEFEALLPWNVKIDSDWDRCLQAEDSAAGDRDRCGSRSASGGGRVQAPVSTSARPILIATSPKSLVEEAEQIYTYSKATRGNIDVVFNLV
jgi:hypothetical protein